MDKPKKEQEKNQNELTNKEIEKRRALDILKEQDSAAIDELFEMLQKVKKMNKK
jgi:hypothetical protein